MMFLQSTMVWAFTALAVPIVIHLWQRRKVIQVKFSTLRFLKIVAAKTSRSAKIENLFLLLLRCLIVALIAWAAMQPILTARGTKLIGGSVPRSVAIIIDHSMSMNYRSGEESRLDKAKQQALAVIKSLIDGDEVVVFAVADRVKALIPEPSVDHTAALAAINAIQPTELRTDLGAGLREARQALAKSTRGERQIFLFTDSQESGWQFDHAAIFNDQWKETAAKLIVAQPDKVNPVNVAVTAVRFDTPFAATGSLVRGVATLENSSDAARLDVLEVRAGKEKVGQRPVEIAAHSSQEITFDFTVPALAERWLQGTVQLGGDNLSSDDRRHFLLGVFQPPRVLIVEQGTGPEKTRPGFFLRKALAAGARSAPIQTCTPNELDDLAVDAFSAVFLAGVPQVSDRSSVRLERYLQSGGTVVLFPGDQTDAANLERLTWLPAKPGPARQLPLGRLVVRALEPQHPLFTNSWDANTPFPALPQRKIWDWKPTADGRVLLSIGEGLPFIIFGQVGPGRMIIVNASPDRAWGDFPLTTAFLPLVQQIARLSVARTGRESNPVVGDTVPVPPTVPREQALTLKTPRGDTQPVASGAPLLERAESPGFYEVNSGAEGLVHQFAVNVDGREGVLTPISNEALTKIVAHDHVGDLEELLRWIDDAQGQSKLWPILLLAALGVYGLESVYSNLLARRRAQGDETHIQTGRLNKRRHGQPFRAESPPEKKEEVANVE